VIGFARELAVKSEEALLIGREGLCGRARLGWWACWIRRINEGSEGYRENWVTH
jgi:hypothetical protein